MKKLLGLALLAFAMGCDSGSDAPAPHIWKVNVEIEGPEGIHIEGTVTEQISKYYETVSPGSHPPLSWTFSGEEVIVRADIAKNMEKPGVISAYIYVDGELVAEDYDGAKLGSVSVYWATGRK